MNVATSPCFAAISLTASLSRWASSAALSASSWRRLISHCDPKYSWFDAITGSPIAQTASSISRITPSGSTPGDIV
jgi:hypothetical protein